MPGPPPSLTLAASVGVVGGAAVAPVPLAPPSTHLTPPPPLESLLHYSFPSEADTLAYVDALKHSDLSDWRSLQEVAARAGAGSCSGAVTTSVLTALYLLGLFNLCVASPASCCVPPSSSRRRRRRAVDPTLPPLLTNLQYNLSSLSLEQFSALPHVTTPDGGRVPLHISVVEQVRKLWDSNPRLLSSVSCSSATESVRSSFISLSGVASGIILAYSVAQLSQCYPDHMPHENFPPKIWFFPIPKTASHPHFPVHSMSSTIPVPVAQISPPLYPMTHIAPLNREDEEDDGCERNEVPLGYDGCALLLSSQPCPYKHWVLLNRQTHMGECVPRLCADNFIYLEADQMCHDVNEPGICPGNRRLYLTASGNAICDCPEGMFPGPHNTCYSLYEQAYCEEGSVLQFDKVTKSLTCKPDACSNVNGQLWPDDLPYAPRPKDGFCYQFNKQGPCSRDERFGYDTIQLEATCVSLKEAGLVRPKRSFMYQQMSFPATQDRQYLHYQVSYIIMNGMNGTTWDLEVKGINRTKRDVSSALEDAPHDPSSGEVAIPFVDTRNIPRDLFPLVRPRLPRWVAHKRTRRGNRHGKRRRKLRRQRNHTTDGVPVSRLRTRPSDRGLPNSQKNHTGDTVSIDLASSPIDDSTLMNGTDQMAVSDRQRNKKTSTNSDNARNSRQDVQEDPQPERTSGHSAQSRRKSKRRKQTSQRRGKTVASRQANQSSRASTVSARLDVHDDSIIRVNQSALAAPVIVQQSPQHPDSDAQRSSASTSTTRGRGASKSHKGKKKRRRRRKKKRRGRNKKKKGRRRGQGQQKRKKPSESRTSSGTKRKKKRKNPNLPFRVPTASPPAGENTTTDGAVISTGDASDGTSVNGMHTSQGDITDEEAGADEDLSSSSEISLPKYLRHRGRRQLGEGGGIIQAPLLSACKPGAKRDYNYKCRPRFIPQGRDRRGATIVASVPRSPTITCPKGTRLDPRGKCQRVS